MPFIFNLVSLVRRHCRSSQSGPDVVDYGRGVAERDQKATFVPETKKKDRPPMKLLGDPKIPKKSLVPTALPQASRLRDDVL
jgi:hypothetical protein